MGKGLMITKADFNATTGFIHDKQNIIFILSYPEIIPFGATASRIPLALLLSDRRNLLSDVG
jgi:hypothetical protein